MQKTTYYPADRNEAYRLLLEQLRAMLDGERNWIATLANTSALLKSFYQDDINWVGYYQLVGDVLILGPFQGLVACTRLPKGKGVCQKAVELKQPVIIQDVHQFADHIVCDSASNSEIVIPIIKDQQVRWVLDIDSPSLNYFSKQDEYYLAEFVRLLTAILD
ncbi:MAG: GAF domain-containing protein [Erysipelotrichaceae bacterium]|nr:GAF domain-containing protein [Erysipelotrichaceae bacterium]